MSPLRVFQFVPLFCLLTSIVAAAALQAADLMPVKFQSAPKHAPIPLVDKGKTTAAIVLRSEGTKDLKPMVRELQEVFKLTTGVDLPVISPKAAEKHEGVLINLGDWDGAATLGLVGSKMPIEGFAIKTAPNAVFIVGHDDNEVDGVKDAVSSGTAWGVSEFMERYLGARWYWPTEIDGRSIAEQKTITIAPVHLTDAPDFRKREYFPPFSNLRGYGKQQFASVLGPLREGSSWPVLLGVHTPRWQKREEFTQGRPEIFQKNQDGSRNFMMLDYAHPRTLETYLEEIEDHVKNGTKKDFIRGKTVTVSPADLSVNSYSDEARALWDADAGKYGQASKVMAEFVLKLGKAMEKRFPDLNILYLPYMNYTLAPDGYKFPGNVYVELCGMPGIAQYKEPTIRAEDQANMEKWVAATGHPVTDWHYSCWPADRTNAPFAYPNVLQAFYRDNREKTMGTFINGGDDNEWLRFHVTLRNWMKLLWSVDYNVNAGLDEFARRMFGAASGTVREILALQVSGWEESRWPDATLTAQSVYGVSYPRTTLEKFQALFAKAHEQVKGDELATRRLAFLEAPFQDFYSEFARVMDGEGLQHMVAMKVMENPKLDGQLGDPVWKDAPPATLRVRKKDGTQVEPKFPTTVQAVWTLDGITFGIHMVEPDVKNLKAEVTSRDHAFTWHDDCVEIFIDVSGKNAGEFVQLLVNSAGAVQDLKTGDETFNLENVKTAIHKGDGEWSMEVFIPYADLDYEKASAGGEKWGIQITRHRARSEAKATAGDENQKLNAGSGGFNSNLSDFSILNFRE